MLTGYNTVSQMYGIGKRTAVKIVGKGILPPPLGTDENINTLISDAATFVVTCYGQDCKGSMSDVRVKELQQRTERSVSKRFNLASLPPYCGSL